MNTKRFVFTALLLITLITASCQTLPPAGQAPTQAPVQPTATTKPAAPNQTPTTAPEQPTATTKPAAPKIAKFIFTQEFDTLNPLYTNMWFSTITFQLWNCYAWDFDDKNQPVPVLVKEIPSASNGGISADGKTITLKLADGIKWSDGTPITADDFIFTYQMTVEKKNTVATTHPYDLLDKVEAPDPATVVMTFKEAFAPWAGTLWKGLLPAHILKPIFEKEGTLDNAAWNKAPTVGCGPFVFKEWQSGSFARFVANENYWKGKPKLDEIFIRFVPDDAAQIAALTTGDGDLGTFFSYPDVPKLQEAKINVYKAYSGYNEGIYFLQDPQKANPALLDVRVRQAIAQAIDREKIAKELLLGLTVPAETDWDNMNFNDPGIVPWKFDQAKAKSLLDEAGWKDTNNDGVRDKDGKELVLQYGTTTREIRKQTQVVIQQQLAEVGIKVELQNFDSDIFFAGFGDNGPAATGKLDMYEYSGQPNFPDPDVSEWLCNQRPSSENPQGTNWMQTCDPELDKLFQLQASQVDPAERQKTFYQITKILHDKVYWLGLWQDPDLWGVNSKLTNVKISGATPFFNIMEWDLAQ